MPFAHTPYIGVGRALARLLGQMLACLLASTVFPLLAALMLLDPTS
jgi:uncharacterized membrane protein YccC